MSETEMAGALRETLWVVVKLGGPLLLASLIVGLVISLVQAVTQINEATLVFLPKLLVVFAAFALLGPFMVESLNLYTHSLMDRLVAVGGQ
ncbi:MAG TPA: flagellar biosynthesis protein FliQ [Acetobacteraceae bacterium]|nr:flagellar biosynthesis protein FliQ [Acetobacteraceae bacterium]